MLDQFQSRERTSPPSVGSSLLGSNSYVDLGFLWHDYQELEAFSLTDSSRGSWSPFGARVKKRNTLIFDKYFSIHWGDNAFSEW